MLRKGRVVAIPTDALYTLVADPYNLRAVSRVFVAKGRDLHRSLPLLINDSLMAQDLARDLSVRFVLLARRFWPGPLTIIVPASPAVPLISTSANISGQPTCRSGIDVFGAMDGRVDLVLDGGLCSGGGATTVDVTEADWRLVKA